MSELNFRAEDHTYWLDSRRLPSVTEIIKDCGLISEYAMQEEAALRGTYVHKACELYIGGHLDMDSVDESIAGWVNSFIRLWDSDYMKEIVSGRVLRSEIPRFDASYLIAGTPDIEVVDELVADIKSGAPAGWHRLQTAAYAQMVGVRRRQTWYLKRDGSMPTIVEHRRHIDWHKFVSCYNVYQMRRGIYE